MSSTHTSANNRPYFSSVTFSSRAHLSYMRFANVSLANFAMCFSDRDLLLISGVSMPLSLTWNRYIGELGMGILEAIVIVSPS